MAMNKQDIDKAMEWIEKQQVFIIQISVLN